MNNLKELFKRNDTKIFVGTVMAIILSNIILYTYGEPEIGFHASALLTIIGNAIIINIDD